MNELELRHELEMSRAATIKMRKDIERAKDREYFSNTDYGRDFTREYAIPFGYALVEACGKTARGRVTVTNIAKTYKSMQTIFSLSHQDIIGVIGVKSLFDSLAVGKFDKPRTIEAAGFIGGRIEDEVRTAYYHQLAPDHVSSYIDKELSTSTSTPHFRRYGAKRGAEKLLKEAGWHTSELYPSWSTELKQRVGLFIVEVAKKLGWVVTTTKQLSKTRKNTYLDLAPAVYADFAHYQHYLESISVHTWPLIAIPKEWELKDGPDRDNYTGGFHHEWIRKQYRLCRSYNSDTEFGKEAIDLLNILNRTAWNIDNDVYLISQDCLDKGFSIGTLKAVDHHLRELLDEDMPEHLKALSPESDKRIEWRKERSMMHTRLSESKKRNIRSRDVLSLANRFRTESRFYLSWSCDYRGRMYSQQALLHPQSSDVERSIITFSDGCKLDDRGEYWASQALGSAFLGSKSSYEERNKWTYKNKQLIQSIAEDPIRHSGQWEKGDEPWQFLQLCMEWNRVVIKKEKHLWDVPISADASASGLQLLSAMRRDTKGMKWSNLFAASSASEAPLDSYIEVLRVARDLAGKDEESSWMVEHLNNRKLGKAVLMTKLYGATASTNRTDVEMILREEGLYPKPFSWKDTYKLTTIITNASRIVFPQAFAALDWINLLFKQAKKNGITSFTWETPNGDTINLKENKVIFKDIRTTHLGKVRMGIEQGDKADYPEMRKALAPSFVHSYDAALLKSAFKGWDKPLALIHDCINVLPNDMDRALDRVKKGFVNICDGDPLAALADDLGVSEEQLKRLPQGKANLEDVLDSTYMMN